VSLEDTGKKECRHKLDVEVWEGPVHRRGRTVNVDNRKEVRCRESLQACLEEDNFRDVLKDNVPSELTPPLLPRLATRATIKN